MPYFEAGDVFNALAEEVDAFKGLSYEKIGEHGVLLNGHRASTEKEMGALVA